MKKVWKRLFILIIMIGVMMILPWTASPSSIGISDLEANGVAFRSPKDVQQITLRLYTVSSLAKYRGYDVSYENGEYQIRVKYHPFLGDSWTIKEENKVVAVPITINTSEEFERIVLSDGKEKKEVYPLSYSPVENIKYFLANYLSIENLLESDLYSKQVAKSKLWINDKFKGNHFENYETYLNVLKENSITEVIVERVRVEGLPHSSNVNEYKCRVTLLDQWSQSYQLNVSIHFEKNSLDVIEGCYIEGILS